MIAGALRGLKDRFLGRGEAAITVPPFDGALKPNHRLEEAAVAADLDAPEDLASDGTALFIADGTRILRLDGSATVDVARFDRPITALACLSGDRFAVALDGREVRIVREGETLRSWSGAAGRPFLSINALSPAPDGGVLASEGSDRQPCERWKHDLMEQGSTGRVVALHAATGEARIIADGLAYAFGVCAVAAPPLPSPLRPAGAEREGPAAQQREGEVGPGDGVYVSESWRHRLRHVGDGRAVIDRLPAYPSRIAPASGGGFWVTAFAARSQLVEFVLREPAYRKRMMREIEPRYWVAPALASGATYLEPMQGGHIKTMGILKPWAPPRSYGLVIRLGPDGLPRYSLHSRVDGRHHGVVAAVECGGELFVLAKGCRRVLRLSLAALEAEFGR